MRRLTLPGARISWTLITFIGANLGLSCRVRLVEQGTVDDTTVSRPAADAMVVPWEHDTTPFPFRFSAALPVLEHVDLDGGAPASPAISPRLAFTQPGADVIDGDGGATMPRTAAAATSLPSKSPPSTSAPVGTSSTSDPHLEGSSSSSAPTTVHTPSGSTRGQL